MLIRIIKSSFLVVLLVTTLVACVISRPFVFSVSKKAPIAVASSENLRNTVKVLSQDFVPRDWRSPQNLDLAAKYIHNSFLENTKNVELQAYTVQEIQYSNVISNYGEMNAPVVVVGAHYDAFSKFPAADDNASGVAGLLELGRLLSKYPIKVPVSLVAYTLEEPPFFREPEMGSYQHVKLLKDKNIPVRLMISLEMIGYFSDEPNSQEYPTSLMKLIYPSTGDFIAIVDRFNFSSTTVNIKKAFLSATNLPVYSINAPSFLVGIDFSDHLNYWNAGIEAVMITDTAFFRNKAYHTDSDTIERLDFEKMAEVVNGVYAYLAALSQ
jgi:Zn-dependent M28 family amino/carboxypeptidase